MIEPPEPSAAPELFGIRIQGPAPAMAVAVDLARRSVWVVPVAVLASAAFWGLDGVWSTLYAIGIVVLNFLLAAWLLKVGGRIGVAVMGAVAMFGFLLRLGLIMVAVLAVRDAAWVELVPLGLTLIITHLGLLFWELRHVSNSLAFPGLKPPPTPNPHLPGSDRSVPVPPPSPSAPTVP